MLQIVDHLKDPSVCRLQTGDLFDLQICRLNFDPKDTNCRFFIFCMQIVDFCIFFKTSSVKSVDVDFLENQLVDCRQEGQIWCNLHLIIRGKINKQINFWYLQNTTYCLIQFNKKLPYALEQKTIIIPFFIGDRGGAMEPLQGVHLRQEEPRVRVQL